jgi:LAS superfamily LD-carboxypeptidase LdcB
MDSSIKTLTITGNAAASGSEPKKSRRASRRKKTDEEYNSFEVQKHEPTLSQPPIVKPRPLQQAQPQPQQTLHQVQAQPQAQPQPQAQLIKTQDTKVILNPPKVRVKLQPKIATAPKQLATTRKARKISLSLSNLNHRFTRARRVRDDTEKRPIDSIRSYLVDKGVIQMKSKAPEKMLRSMYNDFNMLKDGQAL